MQKWYPIGHGSRGLSVNRTKPQLGAIHKLRRQARGRGFAKCLFYYIRFVNRGVGGQKSSKSCLRSLFMAPYLLKSE